MVLAHPTRGFFTLPVDFPPRDEYQDGQVCAEIHGWGLSTSRRATGAIVWWDVIIQNNALRIYPFAAGIIVAIY